MTVSDLAAVVKGVAPAVLHVVTNAVAPLAVKLASLEARVSSIRDGRDGENGKDAEPVDLDVVARKAADLIPIPKDGKDGEAPDVEAVAKVAALLIPTPKDGTNGKDVDPALVESLKAEHVALCEQLAASEVRSADFVKEMRDWLSTEVVQAVTLIPIPKDGGDGASVTVEDVAPLVAREVQKAVAALPMPKDGEKGQDGTNGKDAAPVDLDALAQKAAGLISLPIDLEPDVASASLSDLLRKALPVIAPVPIVMHKRIIRDANGRIDRVVDEPTASL